MGRYDLLLEAETKPAKPHPESGIEAAKPKRLSPPPPRGLMEPVKRENSAKIVAPLPKREASKPSAAQDPQEKIEKYTTHLEPSLIKQIKLFGIERDMKDYQVVKAALLTYFEQNK